MHISRILFLNCQLIISLFILIFSIIFIFIIKFFQSHFLTFLHNKYTLILLHCTFMNSLFLFHTILPLLSSFIVCIFILLKHRVLYISIILSSLVFNWLIQFSLSCFIIMLFHPEISHSLIFFIISLSIFKHLLSLSSCFVDFLLHSIWFFHQDSYAIFCEICFNICSNHLIVRIKEWMRWA